MPEFMLLVKLIRERGKGGKKGDHNVSLGTSQVRELRLKLQIICKNLEALQPPEFVFPKMWARWMRICGFNSINWCHKDCQKHHLLNHFHYGKLAPVGECSLAYCKHKHGWENVRDKLETQRNTKTAMVTGAQQSWQTFCLPFLRRNRTRIGRGLNLKATLDLSKLFIPQLVRHDFNGYSQCLSLRRPHWTL